MVVDRVSLCTCSSLLHSKINARRTIDFSINALEIKTPLASDSLIEIFVLNADPNKYPQMLVAHLKFFCAIGLHGSELVLERN